MASSASRLSASAPPFSINRSSSSYSSMVDSYSGLQLEEFEYDVHLTHHSGTYATEGSPLSSGACATSSHEEYNEISSGYVVSNSKGPWAEQNGGAKEVYQDKILIEKESELDDYIFVKSPSTSKNDSLLQKSISHNVKNPLTIPNLANLTPGLPSTERSVSAKKSSEPFDTYESDLDSPCWKGTLTSLKSPFSVEITSTKTEPEVSKSLNPLAPVFIPVYAEGRALYPFNSTDGKKEAVDIVKGGSCSSKNSNGVQTECFGEIHASKKDFALHNSYSNSEHCSTYLNQPTLVEDSFNCKGIKRAVQNGSSCISSFAVKHVPNVPSSGVSISTELEVKRQGSSNSSCVVLINDLLDLSEQLVHNFSDDFDSLGEQHHDILQNVINNIYVCMRNKTKQQKSVSESLYHDASYFPRSTAEHSKGKYVRLQGTRKKAVSNNYYFGDQNEHKNQKSFSTMFSEKDHRLAKSFWSSSDAGIEKGDDVSQVMEKLMKENHDTNEELNPQALLYKNLWLEAEASLCLMKRKACVARLKNQVDGSKSD